ncbi:lysozyme inhibitor LprI family protein [Vibrio maritimus]|uniref:lysozyme inhibitor LprI family protein n=1 Tax=Vibrio maritimus TaxID=990268 RepID=UPI001F250D88|nr:lysozyme inhibitor LprI family protein [Vibrio maritimus]
MLYKLMAMLIFYALSFSVKSYVNIEFSDDFDIKLEQRKLDYKNGDMLLNEKYTKILEYLNKYDLDAEFKEAQRSWLKYKVESCSGKEFFENTDVSSDIMTQYLIADCMSWVTYARLLEFNYIESRKTELAYILRPNKFNSELNYYTDSWKDYVSKSCSINSKLHNEKIEQCLERINYYYREVDL